ncbi:MAG: D-glycero-alpha-D-manno-heptose-1,7-bisphosphate 7-phosphatase [Gemmatimonadales bacterium]
MSGSGPPWAVFLDRDGTLVEDPGYLSDPAAMRLLPGAAEAVSGLSQAGALVVVVTNQSGIARGLLTEDQYRATERRLEELLELEGARVHAQYHCPHLPEISGPCDCRKPGTGLYLRAAERFGIALERSWWVGDRMRDVIPARVLGGRGILITNPGIPAETTAEHQPVATAHDLPAAVRIILDR